MILTRDFHFVQRAITAENALGAEREALVHRALTAEQATCALMEQHARDSAALRECPGPDMYCLKAAHVLHEARSHRRMIMKIFADSRAASCNTAVHSSSWRRSWQSVPPAR